MPYITRKSHQLYFRMALPRALQPLCGKSELTYPLKATTPSEAKSEALLLASQLHSIFYQVKKMKKFGNEPSFTDVLNNLTSGGSRGFEIGLIGTLPFIKKAEPGEDQANAEKELERVKKELEKNKDQIVETVSTVQQAVHQSKPKGFNIALLEYFEKVAKEKPKFFGHIKPALEHFQSHIENEYSKTITVYKINRNDLKKYKLVLEKMKSHRTKTKDKTLSNSTILKRLTFIEQFFRYCQDEFYYPLGEQSLPTYNLKPEKVDTVKEESSYLAFTNYELELIFSKTSLEHLIEYPHRFWIGTMALLLGGRKSEMVNIKIDDINNLNNEKVWTIKYFSKTKNKNSKRTIPIPQQLLDLNFLDYVEEIKETFGSSASLFPYSKNIEKMAGDNFALFLNKIKISDPRKVLHSFRKNVASKLQENGCPGKYQEHYLGHLAFSIHQDIYAGRDFPMASYKKLIDQCLVFPNLDLTPFNYQKGMFTKYLHKQLVIRNRKQRVKSKVS